MAGELGTLVSDQGDALDKEAARQEGLQQVVATALSDLNSSLAIYLSDSHILKPPEGGPQTPLLWGMRRILWPLLGTAGRGWSFSTFEPPLNDIDPAALPSLPDILFRQAQDMPPTGPAIRREVGCHPFDPSALDDESLPAQLISRLACRRVPKAGW
jgi:hypothetical protein